MQFSKVRAETSIRGHSRILIKGVRNINGTSLIVGNDGNCKGFRYLPVVFYLIHLCNVVMEQ